MSRFKNENLGLENSSNINEWLFNGSSNPIFVLEINTLKFLNVNKAAVIKYGYQKKEFLEKKWTDICSCSKSYELLPQKLQNVNCKHLTKRNEFLNVIFNSFPFEYQGIEALALMITDMRFDNGRNNGQNNLLLSDDSPLSENIKLFNVLASIKEVIFQTDSTGNYTYLSPTWQEITGHSVEESLSKHFLEFIHPADIEENKRKFKELVHSAKVVNRHEVRYLTKDKKLKWIKINVQVHFDNEGKIYSTSGTLMDITERKIFEETLLVRNRALDAAMNGILITDPNLPDNPIIYCNAAFEKNTGYSSEEALGRNCRFLQGPETSKDSLNVIRKAINEGESCNAVIINYKKSGLKFFNELSISPVKDSNGKLINFIGIQTDITERLKDQIALQKSEEKFRNVVEKSGDGIIICDEEGKVIEWNRKLEEITHLSASYALGKKVWELRLILVSKENQTAENLLNFKEDIQNILQTGRSEFVKKYKVVTLHLENKIRKYVHVLIITIKTEKGFMLCYIIRDITDQKKAEEEIKKLSRAVETSPSGILLADLEGKIVYINPTVLSIAGYSSVNQIIGENIMELTDEDGRRQLQSVIIPSLLKGETWKGELNGIKADKTIIPLEMSCAFINHEEPQYLLSMFNDISERKKTESALKESEKKYRTVVNSVHDIIFQTDVEGNWIFLNPAWEEITGFSLQESLGTLFLNYVHPDDREKNMKLFEPVINGKKEFCNHVIRYITKDGGFRWIEVFARLTFDSNNNISGTSGTLNDVTQRIKAEEEIRNALEKEKDLGELKSKFVSTVSHEFRTPLTSIMASNELLLRYYSKWSDEKKIETMKRIEKSAGYMNEMINEVLTLNRAESGKLIFNPAQTDLIRLSHNILEEIKLNANESHKFIINIDEACGSIFGDEKLLRNIITNLLSNAVKYSPAGGEIYYTISKKEKSMELIVKDFGLGIDEEDQKKLFQPFFRGANISNISGTGLGLSILQRAVDLHKGKISFTSKIGEGTTFKILIPLPQ